MDLEVQLGETPVGVLSRSSDRGDATRFRFHDSYKALMKAARATQAAGSYMAHFQPDLQDRKRDWDMVLRAFDNGRNVVQMYHQIVLLSRIEDVSRTEHAVRAVWRARGFDLAKDVYLQHQAFVASMPCTLTPAL